MGKREGLARTCSAKDVAAVSTMVLAVGEGKGGSTSHADTGVCPFRRLHEAASALDTQWHQARTYSAAVEHAAGDLLFGREPEALPLEVVIDFAYV
jgi:hypothetical protein